MKKFLILLLTLTMVASLLISCTTGNGNDDTTPADDGKNEVTTPEEGGDDDGLPEVIDMSSNGQDYVYKAYVRSKEDGDLGNGGFLCEDFWVAETSEDALSFAVYTRNNTIQETYHCRIHQQDSTGSTYQELKDFYANSEKYDLSILLAIEAAPAATSNLLQDIKSMGHVDLTHSSYDQNSVAQFSMGGKLYYLSGDMNISTMDNTAPTVVNIEMYNSHKESFVEAFGDEIYSNIYDLVTEHEWTMDTLLTMAEIVNVDQNKSDGALSVTKQDTLGYFQYSASPLYYFYGAGGRITQIDEDGYPELVIGESINQEIYDYVYRNLNTVSTSWIPNGNSGPRGDNFYGGVCLFTDMTLWDIRKILYTKDAFEYGIIPNPLYEAGDDYHGVVYFQVCAHLWSVPNMCTNQEYAERMLQILTVYSGMKDSTMDAYYTKTMYMTVAQDKGSRAAMDIIRTSLVYDIALLYDWGGFQNLLLNADTATSNQYQTYYNKLDVAEEAMQLTLEQFKNPTYVPDN